MPRTRAQLEQAAADAEAWLDQLADDETATAEDASDLRAIAAAVRALSAAEAELDDAVAAARTNGKSWGAIGAVLGVSKQAARVRYGRVEAAEL